LSEQKDPPTKATSRRIAAAPTETFKKRGRQPKNISENDQQPAENKSEQVIEAQPERPQQNHQESAHDDQRSHQMKSQNATHHETHNVAQTEPKNQAQQTAVAGGQEGNPQEEGPRPQQQQQHQRPMNPQNNQGFSHNNRNRFDNNKRNSHNNRNNNNNNQNQRRDFRSNNHNSNRFQQPQDEMSAYEDQKLQDTEVDLADINLTEEEKSWLNSKDLKSKNIQQLTDLALKLKIENAAGMRRQDMVFEILSAQPDWETFSVLEF